MRHWFTWLLALGILAGLQGRVLGADPCEVMAAMHEQEHSGHHHEPGKPCDPSHDKNCPLDHHHHGACAHAMPMAAEPQRHTRAAFDFSLSPIRRESERAPEAPFAELDKPPLI